MGAHRIRAQDFYDPVNEKFTEPKHPGISYSFSADGNFEESYYRAVANRMSPAYPPHAISHVLT